MDTELKRIILLYQDAIADLFPKLAAHLHVSLPISNIDWTALDIEQVGRTDCGIEYFIHGYGVAMRQGGTKIDFDLGDKGQIDGIDPWKLWDYLAAKKIKNSFKSAEEIKMAVKKEVAQGNLIYSGYMLHYLPSK